MIMASATIVAGVRRSHSKRLLQAERQQRLSRDLHFLASSQHLRPRSRSRPHTRADCRALPAPRDRADNRTQRRAAAHISGGSLVRPKTVLLLPAQEARVGRYHVTLALHRNRLQIERQLSVRSRRYYQLYVRAARNGNVVTRVHHVLVHHAGEHPAIGPVVSIVSFVRTGMLVPVPIVLT